MISSRWLLLVAIASAGARAQTAADTPVIPLPTAPIKLPAPPPSAVEREAAVELPPMIVSESAKSPWLYAAVGEAEYLSRCSPATTRAYITAQLEIARLLRLFIPADFFSKNAVPIVSLIAPFEAGVASDDVASREMQRMEQRSAERANDAGRAELRVPRVSALRFLPNLRLDDRDMMAVFTYLKERDFPAGSLIAAPDYVYARLVARTPMLPPWLIEGLTGLYQQSSFRGDPITLGRALWVFPEDTAGLRRDPESRRVLLPAGDLFAADALVTAEKRHPTRIAAWRAEAVLFVRWALDPANAPAAAALWKFARRVSSEPPTEAIFNECFGFGYADLLERLSDYVPVAVKEPTRIIPGKLPRLPRFELKPATPQQVARLRGEWERLEIPFVRGKHPEFLPRYIEQARTTLRRAVGRGDRGIQILAALGLCELDAGDPAAARPWLEQAAAAGIPRPRVHYEIGRLRWIDLTRDTGEKNGFTATQLQPVLEPLRVAAVQTPPLPEVYLLIADAWLRCRDRINPSDLALLVAATPNFRRLPGLAYRVALLQVREGQRAEAVRLLQAAGEFVTDAGLQTQYQQLLAALATPGNSASAPR